MALSIATRPVLVDNDWAGDPDGLVALAHHLLSPSDAVIAVTSSTLNPVFGPPEGTAERGAELARALLERIERSAPVAAGADTPFADDSRETAAARLIVDAARSHDDGRLTVVCGGPLTNVADALRVDPGIAERIRLLWVGGTIEDGAFEYNQDTDADAARFALAADGLELIRFPAETYRLPAISVAELEDRLVSSGPVGRWLWERYEQLPLPEGFPVDPVWPLGDSVPLAFTALPHAATRLESVEGHQVCTALDSRLIIEDLFARLRLANR
ncbi:nucleoside hydrolase [Microbacterium sp. ZW T5_45]|uniref:nucleoside hydrolase n=1 Tax=Microbacterium sp. ZW T5_45 TaxID=3378080 RepID=UPI003853B3E7